MNVLILAALKLELDSVIRKYNPEIFIKIGRQTVYRRKAGNTDFFFGITGVGRESVRKFFDLYNRSNINADFIISTGFAGSMSSGLTVGDTVLPAYFFCPKSKGKEQDAEYFELSILPKTEINFNASYGGLTGISSDSLLSRNQKTELRKKYHQADFVDMESSEVIKQCRAGSIPFVIVRCISDDYGFVFPRNEFIRASFREINIPRLAVYCLNPVHLYRVVKMFLNVRKAGKSLAVLLERIMEIRWESRKMMIDKMRV